MIHHLTPFSTEKNIGGAYNEAIRHIQAKDDDWIVIRDGDTMFLTPNWGMQISEVAKSTDFTLLGCVTNRLRNKSQLFEGKFDSEMNVEKSFNDSLYLEREHWGEVERIGSIAGFFMMFKYRTWIRAGGFAENTVKADMLFNQAVNRIGGQIGIMKGLYVFHGYRPWENIQHKAMNSTKHLYK